MLVLTGQQISKPIGRMYKLTNMLGIKFWNNATNIRMVSQYFHMLGNGVGGWVTCNR